MCVCVKVENHCSRKQRTQQSSGNRNTDRGGRGRGATSEGRRGGEAEGGAWGRHPAPGHVTQRSAPAPGGGPAHRGKDGGAHTADCSASERFWTRSSPRRERDTADSRRHGAAGRPCKHEACPLEQARPGR